MSDEEYALWQLLLRYLEVLSRTPGGEEEARLNLTGQVHVLRGRITRVHASTAATVADG